MSPFYVAFQNLSIYFCYFATFCDSATFSIDFWIVV
nr:MAG TPA: hypothetical protein [Caudoviricetes sp.]